MVTDEASRAGLAHEIRRCKLLIAQNKILRADLRAQYDVASSLVTESQSITEQFRARDLAAEFADPVWFSGRMEFQQGENVPVRGRYIQLNVFGTPTNRLLELRSGEQFPDTPVGHEWQLQTVRPKIDLTAEEIAKSMLNDDEERSPAHARHAISA